MKNNFFDTKIVFDGGGNVFVFAEYELHKSQGVPGGERNKKFQNISKTRGLKNEQVNG